MTIDLLRNQFRVAWALLDYHLVDLDGEDLHWSPCDLSWDVRFIENTWVPDWQDIEPQPIPVPTVAWLTWHIGWWWSTALAHLRHVPAPHRRNVAWPGDVNSTVTWLHQIHLEWLDALQTCPDLEAPSAFPWESGFGFSRADMCAWVAIELTKNAAELGQLKLIRRASEPTTRLPQV